MNYSVISIVEGIVVLESENGIITKHNISEFSDEIKEGYIVECDISGVFYVDKEKTDLRRQTVHNKMIKIFKKKHN